MDTHECSRRSFLRAAGGLAGLLFTMGMTDALEPEVADALDVPVNFQALRRINYAGGITHEFRVNGNLAFCCNPSYRNPPSGIYHEVHDDVAWDSNAWNDSAYGQNYQRIMTFESKGKLIGKKDARYRNWL